MNMRELMNIVGKTVIENDAEHQKALDQTGFWGRAGAGCLFLAKDTKRLLIAYRSRHVEQPHTWGTWGGAIDPKENPQDAVRREVQEESGYHGSLELAPMAIFKHSSGFRYFNFIAVVEKEFTPRLDWESEGFKWVDFGDWPDPLHPGVVYLLSQSSSEIEALIARV